MDNKCYGCTKRELGCHSNCNEYALYKVKLEKEKQFRKFIPSRANLNAKDMGHSPAFSATFKLKCVTTKVG